MFKENLEKRVLNVSPTGKAHRYLITFENKNTAGYFKKRIGVVHMGMIIFAVLGIFLLIQTI
jgi:hypothetical protein